MTSSTMLLLELLVDGEGAGRRRVLGAKPVTAADDGEVADLAFLHERVHDIKEQRLALGARLLRAVHDGDLLAGCRQGLDELRRNERTVQADLHEADLLAIGVQVVDDLFDDVAERAHRNDDAIGVGRAVIVEQLVVGAELGIDGVHVFLNDFG